MYLACGRTDNKHNHRNVLFKLIIILSRSEKIWKNIAIIRCEDRVVGNRFLILIDFLEGFTNLTMSSGLPKSLEIQSGKQSF